jgi:protein-S-isoprenylcysteine O-methyltransferase Ste14
MIEMSVADVAFGVVIAGWLIFAGAMLAAWRHSGQVERRRDRSSVAGLVLQTLGYAAVFRAPRAVAAPLLAQTLVPGLLLCALTVVLTAGSVWMVTSAVRTLGRQWSLAARVIEGHELVTSGPYRVVRHPIYSGMIGMLVATGIAITAWWWLIVGAAVFVTGTLIRTRAEERLLRGQFGAAYEAYAARVPALIPFI